ncbi:hypothetical protein I3760_01G041200 [Carya illinoinensis]|nr:hypothetical protein I3760_01G041200 [Carya illinoinensis]
MFRVLSTQKSHRGYERLADEPAVATLEGNLRTTSLLAKIFGSSRKLVPELIFPRNSQAKPTNKFSKSHPLLGLFCTRSKKKTTAKSEFARYLEYEKEGGVWNMNSNLSVIYYK